MFETVLRLLTFRINREDIRQFTWKHFLVGLTGTWIVGMGRYWDDENASALQHLGLGSVLYIFILAFFIWIIIKPLKVENWTYFTTLTFISLTSFPAIFYAIPVEKFLSLQKANSINVWFLAVVAGWRLSLLYHFLRVFTKLSVANVITVTLMPICLIITALTVLNLERAVFNVMGGLRHTTPNDDAYKVLIGLTVTSAILILPLFIAYAIAIDTRRHESTKKSQNALHPDNPSNV